ncbi:hypothetical protein [Natrarchaeobius chitinivorans]|uniref:Cbb3-type cytochrome c oxidase subunit I n=1 Tax=Natrarchaeobius chitinivorans TaxID=1679083 RepID=A0A3N6P8F5_NATCH|nr:hypothetical protein [Natrarchaeobius chitinivorans]RQG94929.1 hypothetical protein EA473_10555 [Natrarchaeobius chitinivorans]
MGAILGNIDADQSPPLTVPLRHFLVGIGFLLVGAVVGPLSAIGVFSATLSLAHVHLLLAGWVCVTIMGAMTQFVPVWSAVELHSRRLAKTQLWIVTVGLAVFAIALLTGTYRWLPVGGVVMLLGFWVFVYNVGRTLASARPWDVTERHFAIALGFFVLLTTLGVTLAIGFVSPVFRSWPVSHGSVRLAHATLAVYGAVLTTVFGALYQLATMFTQSDLHGIDHAIQRLEEIGFPIGVVALAGGRLFEIGLVARVGGILILASVLGFGVLLARRLYEAQVPWTPMLSRYVVVATAMVLWPLWTGVYWVRDPLDPTTLFGAPGSVHLLAFGLIGFVVLGTLYHIIPFIIWVHRYSDLLGLEDVPMIDDLYDDRLAAADFALLTVGLGIVVLTDVISLPTTVSVVGGGAVIAGAAIFAANMVLVVRRHSPQPLLGILFDRFAVRGDGKQSQTGAESSHLQP